MSLRIAGSLGASGGCITTTPRAFFAISRSLGLIELLPSRWSNWVPGGCTFRIEDLLRLVALIEGLAEGKDGGSC